ncbi:PP0621 family protein [Sulfurimonas sp.]|uniref:PP0621 family protein n=1 Tax=Sulfurimonas sp. TaxID=2022749 RepID=UPI0026095AEE|nr:PP0621 family protein [Sulfurimonas sp.]
MILKFLLIAAVIAIVYFVFFKAKPSLNSANKKNDKKPEVNDMVECEVCGVYTEIHEAILSNGKYYCSSECLKKGK